MSANLDLFQFLCKRNYGRGDRKTGKRHAYDGRRVQHKKARRLLKLILIREHLDK